jgi:hypothetical protein
MKHAQFAVLIGSLCVCSSMAGAQSKEKEPIAVVGLGAAASRSLDDGSSGPAVAVEVTPIENWLELETGLTQFSTAPLQNGTPICFSRSPGPSPSRQSSCVPRLDSSVVERGPEKASGGGSIPSLAANLCCVWVDTHSAPSQDLNAKNNHGITHVPSDLPGRPGATPRSLQPLPCSDYRLLPLGSCFTCGTIGAERDSQRTILSLHPGYETRLALLEVSLLPPLANNPACTFPCPGSVPKLLLSR